MLLIEEESAAHRVTRTTLTATQFEVAVASDGVEALSTLREEPHFDVLLLDSSMPEVGGPSLSTALQKLAPGARILCFTGEDEAAVEPTF